MLNRRKTIYSRNLRNLAWGDSEMITSIKKFMKEEDGATMIEYGLIAALVSVAAVIALTALGGSLSSMFTSVSDKVKEVTPDTTTTTTTTGS